MTKRFAKVLLQEDPRRAVRPLAKRHTDPRTGAEVLRVRSAMPSRGTHDAIEEGEASSSFVARPQSEMVNRAPAELLESARYQEHAFRWTPAMVNALTGESILEIARWHVPARHLGILDHIDTHFGVTLLTDDRNPLDIGINLPWQPWLHEVLGLRLRWWLRLEARRELEERSPVALFSPNELPGAALPELPTWTDQRFGWNYHGRRPLRILILEQTALRLFVGAESQPAALMKSSSSSPFAFTRDAIQRAALFQGLNADLPPYSMAAEVVSEPLEGELRAAAAAEAEEGPSFAGRLIGTIQLYRDNPGAIEAARRGL
jgi:hypothetical protein